MTKGWIHSIESLGTQDGPGIRYVIFTQGCPLRCKYCHNPDTWCMQDGQQVEVEELIDKILRCKTYIDSSDGGVTISGGEPTMQLEFIKELLKRCQKEGIHTAIDTSGYMDTERFQELLPYIDLVLLDIKHIDDSEHQKLTGVSNQKTLNMVEFLEENHQEYWVRHVVVPEINDNTKYIKRLAEFLKPLDYLSKVELISYHELGVYKWKEIGLEYELEDIQIPSNKKMKDIQKIFDRLDINTVIK